MFVPPLPLYCRFVVGSNRVIFMLRDGSFAWEVKDFLVAQERCAEVTVEGQVFPGKAAKKDDSAKQQNEVNTKKKGKKKSEGKKPDLDGNRASKDKVELWLADDGERDGIGRTITRPVQTSNTT